MRFEHTRILWFLALLAPGLAVFFWWSWRQRQRLISQFVQSRLLAQLTVGVSAARQKARMALLGVAVLLVIVVLARPQWGFAWEEARQRGLDIVVAIDTSKSMLATDVAPNRLARAKLSALDLKRLARNDRMGLVAFAGSAFLQCPLSIDEEAFRQSVNALDVNIIPQGGTALSEAMLSARGAFKEKNDNHKILVIFTDGEDHDGHALEVARDMAKEGMRIFTIGLGTAEGEMLRTTDAKGRSDFLRDDSGNAVKSRLNEGLLRQIAQVTEGFYLFHSGANSMDLLYERGLAPLPKTEFSARQIKRWHERYKWFLALALGLLLLEMLLPQRRAVRRTEAILQAANADLKKAVSLLALLLLPSAVLTASPAAGLKQYQAGRYGAALREYEAALRKRPNDPRLSFNAGAAAHAAREFDTALQHLNAALVTPDLALQQQAYYNLGNTYFRRGEKQSDPGKKKSDWEQSVSSFESTLQLNPQDGDARFNLELVKRKLEELKQEQEDEEKKENTPPSEEAKKAKAQADEAVRRRDYRTAFDIMARQMQKDSTTRHYADYIQRLQQINGITNSPSR